MTPQQVRFALVSLRNEAMADGQRSDMLHLDAAIDCINRLRVLRSEKCYDDKVNKMEQS